MTFNVGEVGRRLIVNANYDMSAKTVLSIDFTRPDGTEFTRSGSDVTISAAPLVTESAGTLAPNKYAMYSLKAGDLNQPGEYLVRLQYEDATPMVLIAGGTSFTVSE